MSLGFDSKIDGDGGSASATAKKDAKLFGKSSTKASEKFVPWEPYRGAVQRPDRASVSPTLTRNSSAPSNLPRENGTMLRYQVSAPIRKISSKKQLEKARELGSREDLVIADGQEKNSEENRPRPPKQQVDFSTHHQGAQKSSGFDDDVSKMIEDLKKERNYYKEQVSYQSQVNAELKRLVVATMGDDLQLHLEGLSQDKAKLAQNIAHFSRELSQGHENIQKLAIDSDVWRSKFLACSVMVDELVGWRLYLIRQFEDSQLCMEQILQEHEYFRQHLFQTILLMLEIRDALDPLESNAHRRILTYHNLYDLVITVHSIADSLHNRLMNGRKHEMMDTRPEKGLTESEEMATKLISLDTDKFYGTSPCTEEKVPKKRAKQLIGMTGMNCKFKNLTVNCCRHCNGEIKLV